MSQKVKIMKISGHLIILHTGIYGTDLTTCRQTPGKACNNGGGWEGSRTSL